MKTFKNKTAVITGGANGVGKSLAQLLYSKGMNIAILDIDNANLSIIKKELGSQQTAVTIHECDISKWDQVERSGREILQAHSSIDLLINSAAVSIHSPLEFQSASDIEWITKINYLGTAFICKFFIPALKNSEDAHIVNIASGAGIHGFAKRSTYCASKFAVRGLSEALRAELYEHSIGVSCVFPSGINTKMYTRSRYHDKSQQNTERKYLEKSGQHPDVVARSVLKGIRKNKAEIYPSGDVRMLKRLKGLFPGLTANVLTRNQDKLPV